MMMMTRSRAVIVLLSVSTVIASCGGGGDGGGTTTTEPPPPPPVKATVNGTWIGTTNLQTLTVAVAENAGSVTGSGTLSSTTGPLSLTGSGTFTGSTLTMTLTSGQHPPFTLTATLSGTTLIGTLAGSGFTGDPITLNSTSAGAGIPTKITVSSATSVETDATTTVAAVVSDKFDNFLSSPITWSSSANSVALVQANASVPGAATITGVAPGQATITASSTIAGVTVTNSTTATVTLSPLVGTWNLTAIGNTPMPVTINPTGFATKVIFRTLVIQTGHAGTWADSTLSGLACTPLNLALQCQAGGRAPVNWLLSGSTLSVIPAPGAPVTGSVFAIKLFTRNADGTLTSSGNQGLETYRKQ